MVVVIIAMRTSVTPTISGVVLKQRVAGGDEGGSVSGCIFVWCRDGSGSEE